MKSSFSILSFVLIVISATGIYLFGDERVEIYEKPYYFAPPEVIKYFAFGYNDVYADLLWMRYIQDADFCNSELGIPIYNGRRRHQCHKGWGFHMVNAIIELAPRFRKPYILAGTVLGVLSGDKEGARVVLDKAVERFPEDWEIFFHAAHLYLFELDNQEKAAELLLESAKNGGPIWLYKLSAKLYTKAGKLDVAEQMLKKMIDDDPDSPYVEDFKRRLKEVQKQKMRQNLLNTLN